MPLYTKWMGKNNQGDSLNPRSELQLISVVHESENASDTNIGNHISLDKAGSSLKCLRCWLHKARLEPTK